MPDANTPVSYEDLIDLDGLSTYHTEILKLFRQYQLSLDGKVNVVSGKGLSTNDFTTAYKDKLDTIQTNAEVNQNAYSNIIVGNTTLSANAKTDSLTLVPGTNVAISADVQNGTITITANNNTYSIATDQVAGLMKLYTTSGNNEDGTMTQKAITDQLNSKVNTTRTINTHALTSDIVLSANDVGAVASTEKGTANGVAELDSTGHIPSSQLPAYVDEIVEAYYNTTNGSFYRDSEYTNQITGERDKIYVDLTSNLTYRWSGSQFVEISPSIALGETQYTAYRGDRGKIAYDYAIAPHAPDNAEANIIVEIQKNGTAVTPDANRTVNLIIPTKTSDLTNDMNFITSSGTAAEATVLETPQNFSISGGAVTNTPVSFDGSSAVNLVVTSLNARYLMQNVSDTLILNGNFL